MKTLTTAAGWICDKKMSEDIGVELCIPRFCNRQDHRDNFPAGTSDKYYKRNLTISLLDHVLMEMKSRFLIDQQSATYGIRPCYNGSYEASRGVAELICVVHLYKTDLPYPESV